MKLKFIGTDGSMGLKHGEVYDVRVTAHRGDAVIIVQWGFVGANPIYCPYSSPAAFAANWAKPGQPQKVVVRKKKTVKDGPCGEWVWTERGTDDRDQCWVCSKCGDYTYFKTNYCSNCGAKMDGGAET